MTDISDGSSSAAQSALQEKDEPVRRGFLARLFRGDDESLINGSDANSHGLGNLRQLRLEDVAVPRADIVGVPVTSKFDDLIKVFKETALSRLPVYDETLDNPLGMIHLKDIALKYGFNGKPSRPSIKRNLRPVLFAPPSMPIGVLLQKMQSERTHMALMIDEYGGVDGLVTIEDLLEQVVGEIVDEHDTEEDQAWIEEKPGVYLVQARASLSEFETAIGVSLSEEVDVEDIDTLGGLVFMMLGRVPARGEVIPHSSGFEFEVVDADPRRVKRLRVCKPDTKT